MKRILTAICLLAFGAATTLSAQLAETVDKKEIREQIKAEIESIKNNSTLTEEEKKVLIKEKRAEVKEKYGERGSRKGPKKGNKEAKAAIDAIKNDPNLTDEEKTKLIEEKKLALKQERTYKTKKEMKKGALKKMNPEVHKEIEAIKNNPELSNEEKAALIKEKRAAVRSEMRGERGSADASARKAEREQIKQELDAINEDPNLTNEEKKAKRKALLGDKAEQFRKRGKQGKGKGKGSNNGFSGQSSSDGTMNKANPSSTITKRKLTEEQRADALERLDKRQAALAKELKKGKISQVDYDQKMAKVEQVRKQVIEN